jgi:hypothetical protein
MTVNDIAKIEGCGSAFDLEGFLAVRDRTRRAVHMIADQITPGMSEEEAKDIAGSSHLRWGEVRPPPMRSMRSR